MTIEEIPVEKIRPAAYNPRRDLKPGDPAYDRLKKALDTFGLVDPLVWNQRTGNLVGGHQRYKVLLERGDTKVPVSVVDLDEKSEKALNLALNKQGGEWDFATLADLVQELDCGDLDMDITGFTAAELEKLAIWTPPDEDAEPEPPIPDLPKNPLVKQGELWMLGDHRLMCGDARNSKHVRRLIGKSAMNVVFTSPPYASQREYDESSGFRPIPPDKYVDWYRPVAKNIMGCMADDGSYFLNIKPSAAGLDTELYVFDLVLDHVREVGFHFATEFCWERSGVPKAVTQRFKNQFEPIYQFAVGRWKMRPDTVRHFSENVPTAGGPGSGETSWANVQGGKGAESVSGSFGAAKKRRRGTSELMSSVQGQNFDCGDYIGPGLAYPGNRLPTFSSSHHALGHVAAFPVGLPSFFLKAYSDESDTVYDPFAGSGSTIIAAEQLGRISYGMEISPGYCDVIIERFETVSGKKAVRA